MSIHIYVCGAFNLKEQKYGTGIVFAPGTSLEEKISFRGNDIHLLLNAQIAGELSGAIFAIQKVLAYNKDMTDNGLSESVITDIVLHHRFYGISKWPLGQAQAKQLIGRKYLSFMTEAMQQITIKFMRVRPNGSNKFNTIADNLAREACGLNVRY